jgi:hypothetical protein
VGTSSEPRASMLTRLLEASVAMLSHRLTKEIIPFSAPREVEWCDFPSCVLFSGLVGMVFLSSDPGHRAT